jgi:acetyl-CoA carboxylase carboxyl transferase subunit beta
MAADRAAQAGPGRAGSRPLYEEVADAGSLTRLGEEIEAANPSDWPGYPDQLRLARKATGARHAVTTGMASVGGEACVLVGFEFGFLGGSMGTAEGAGIARAFSVAAAERLPIVCVSASGGSRMQEGTSALLQMQAVAAAIAEARRAGIPHAELFVAMASSQVPVTSVVIGEGVSGGALALASPNDLWIARDGYLAVTAPELASSILKLGVRDVPQVATWLRLTPAELLSRGIVRGIIGPRRSGGIGA